MKRFVLGSVLALATGSAFAGGVVPAQALLQPYFRSLATTPSAGIGGADPFTVGSMGRGIGLISDDGAVTAKAAPVVGPRHLPWGLDFGNYYGSLPADRPELSGIDMSYRLKAEGAFSPGLSVHGSYTRLSGADHLALDSRGLDLSLSKGFGYATPYAGLGRVWLNSSPDAITGLADERLSLNKYFVGANFRIGLTDLALEADKTGPETTLGAKFGLRF